MRRQRLRAMPRWRKDGARYDCVFVEKDSLIQGMRGLDVCQVLIFFSFRFQGNLFPCALVRWFKPVGDAPCENTGMWIVEPQIATSVINLNCVLCGAHLIPVFGRGFVPDKLHFSDSLRAFRTFYVNKFADHHSHEVAF